jgi:hypothetical protein
MKKTDKKNIVLLAIIVLSLMLVNLILYFNKFIIPSMKIAEMKEDYEENSQNEYGARDSSNPEDIFKPSEYEWLKLHLVSENERMKYYFSHFMVMCIGNGRYEEAYNLLYDDFKKNYFDTYEKFKTYVEEKYPYAMTVTYEDIQKQGEYHILEVTIKDIVGHKENITQRFVIKEADFNDYKISFSV